MSHEPVVKSVADAPDGIDELCRCAARLVETARGTLKSLRLQSGDRTVELEWCAPEGPAEPVGGVAAGAPLEILSRGVAVVEALPDSPPPDGSYVVCAPLVGTFYRAPSPDAPPFVAIGQQVVPGQQLAIVEAMKLMNAVQTDRPGVIVDVLVTDGSAVEYGDALFVIAPA